MNTTLKAGIVTAAALFSIVGCTSAADVAEKYDKPDRAPVAETVTPEPAETGNTPNEDRFLETLRDYAPFYIHAPDRMAIDVGRTVCETLDAGATIDDVLAALLVDGTPKQAGVMAGSAVAVFCPEYAHMWDEGTAISV